MKNLLLISILLLTSCYQPDDSPETPPLKNSSGAKIKVLKDSLSIFKKFPSNHNKIKDFELYRANYYRSRSMEKEYQKDITFLDKLIEWDTQSFSFNTVDSLIRKWQLKKIPPYNTDIIFLSCNQIWENKPLNDTKKAAVISGYAKMAKRNFDQLDLESYKYLIELGSFEAENLAQLKGIVFEKAREELVTDWLHTGAMWQANIDPDYNSKQMIFLTVGIPQGFEGSDKYCCNSIDPSSIKEPKLRQAYKDSILKNSWVVSNHNTQYFLRKEYKWALEERLKNNIIYLYSMPPENITELETVINKFIADSAYKKYIFDNVYKNFRAEN